MLEKHGGDFVASVLVEGRGSFVNVEGCLDLSQIFRTRFREHTDGKNLNSAIAEHTSSTGLHYTLDDTKILVREEKWFL